MASSVAASPIAIHCQGVLFDMDGILISSLGSVERSWAKWGHMRGVDAALAIKTAHGCRAIETVAKLRPDLDSEDELKVIEEIEIEDNEGLTVLPGVLSLLHALTQAGSDRPRWTVVTSATERLARARMAVGGIPTPERIVTADRVTRGKPHPEPYLDGAALLGFKPEECVVFEDSTSGTQAGRAAGCTVVATTFSHPIETLGAAHHLVDDLTGVSAQRDPASNALILRLTPRSDR